MAIESYYAWGKIVDIAFHGNRRIRAGRPKCLMISDPANNVPAACPVGTLLLDSSNAANLSNNTADVYICSVANTTLIKISA